MIDRFTKTCEHEFERGVLRCLEKLFENPVKIPGTGMATIPIIGGEYILDLDHTHLLPMICTALCARENFRRDAPAWAPSLPLSWEDCEELENADDVRLNVVGLFGSSLYLAGWDYEAHPRIGAFASGLMAYPSTPVEIRNDRSLRQEFPPRALAGLADGQLHWRSPERLAFDRDMRARIAAYEARMGTG